MIGVALVSLVMLRSIVQCRRSQQSPTPARLFAARFSERAAEAEGQPAATGRRENVRSRLKRRHARRPFAAQKN